MDGLERQSELLGRRRRPRPGYLVAVTIPRRGDPRDRSIPLWGTTPQGAGLRTTVPNPNSLKASTPPHSGACRKAEMAFAKTGRIRPSVVLMGGLERSKSFFHTE